MFRVPKWLIVPDNYSIREGVEMSNRDDVIQEIIKLYTVRQGVGILHPYLNNFMLLLEDIIDERDD